MERLQYKAAIEAVHTLAQWAAGLQPDTAAAEAAWTTLHRVRDESFVQAATVFLATITSSLQKAQTQSPSALPPGSLTIDEALARIRVGEPPAPMTEAPSPGRDPWKPLWERHGKI